MPDADRIAQLPAAAPPANIEAEQAVLGALLLNNDAVDRVHPLRAEHFTEPAHRRIFEAIRRLTDRGQVANPVTLKGYFEKDDALIEVGGAIYLARLAGAATSVASAAHYARAVRDLAIRRELLQAAHDVAHEAAHPDADDDSPAAIIDRAEARIYALRDVDPRGGPVALDVAVDDALNHAEVAAQAPGGMLGVTTGLHELDRITGGCKPQTCS